MLKTFFKSPDHEPEEPEFLPNFFQHTKFDEWMLFGFGLVCSIPCFIFLICLILHEAFGI